MTKKGRKYIFPKRVEEVTVYYFICPYCRLFITALNPNSIHFKAANHLRYMHKSNTSLDGLIKTHRFTVKIDIDVPTEQQAAQAAQA